MKKIRLNVIPDDLNDDHFSVHFEKPGRIEITVVDGLVLAHVYEGAENNLDQEPIGGYDSSIGENNSWEQ